ncbi:hypothetical protein FJT64_002570 [Amphibalanus amphitrite]|uniref:Uncharacterized protein n=1 Tax=Amphibalanus amphitrite TaxID=1232801 RepID=A0A6A4WTG0_AMPAM|nr:hypothetical protein FJT64_002570 [Amphibalanus amphitrite]
MERSGAHLLLPPLLLLTPVAAVRYRLQDAASFAGSRVHAAAAASALDCGLRCEGEPAQNCSGFTFEPANNTFSLYSGHCRGLAVTSLGSLYLPDEAMTVASCACPGTFSRCGGRCLLRLDVPVNHTDAEGQCAEQGAHLAVPRSEVEHQCAVSASGGQRVWLCVTDLVTQ